MEMGNIPHSNYDENPPNYPTQQSAQYNPYATNQSASGRTRYCRNLPQFLSVGAGACIICIGKMSERFTYSIVCEEKVWLLYMLNSSYVMAIVGAFLSAALTNFLTKKKLFIYSAVLVMYGGLLILLSSESCYAAKMVPPPLNGFAHGWIFVTILVMAGEEAAKEVRGLISSTAAIIISLGSLIHTILEAVWNSNNEFQLRGIFVLILGSISIALVLTKVIESPVYFLKRNQEQQALDCVKNLQQPAMIDAAKYAQLDEYKHYIAESSGTGRSALSALLKLSLLSGTIALCNCIAGLWLRHISKSSSLSYSFFVIACCCHVAGVSMGSLSQDLIGRRLVLIVGMLFNSGMGIGLGVIFYTMELIERWQIYAASGIFMVFNFSTGLCKTSLSSYLSEAFPVTVKPYCIACVLSIENAMYIIFKSISIDFSIDFIVLFCLVLSLCTVFIVLYFPETKNTSLRIALLKFKKFQP